MNRQANENSPHASSEAQGDTINPKVVNDKGYKFQMICKDCVNTCKIEKISGQKVVYCPDKKKG